MPSLYGHSAGILGGVGDGGWLGREVPRFFLKSKDSAELMTGGVTGSG